MSILAPVTIMRIIEKVFLTIIDWRMLQEDGKFIGGYALNIDNSYIWPTSTLFSAPSPKTDTLSSQDTLFERLRLLFCFKNVQIIFEKCPGSRIPGSFLLETLRKRLRAALWYGLVCKYYGLIFPPSKRYLRADKYFSFERGVNSRMRYRKRFVMTIMSKFFFNNTYILFGLIIAHSYDIHLERQLATRIACYITLTAIPLNLLGIALFGLFYHKFHIWKKEGAVVGYKYDAITEKLSGCWYSAKKVDEDMEMENMDTECGFIDKQIESDVNDIQKDTSLSKNKTVVGTQENDDVNVVQHEVDDNMASFLQMENKQVVNNRQEKKDASHVQYEFNENRVINSMYTEVHDEKNTSPTNKTTMVVNIIQQENGDVNAVQNDVNDKANFLELKHEQVFNYEQEQRDVNHVQYDESKLADGIKQNNGNELKDGEHSSQIETCNQINQNDIEHGEYFSLIENTTVVSKQQELGDVNSIQNEFKDISLIVQEQEVDKKQKNADVYNKKDNTSTIEHKHEVDDKWDNTDLNNVKDQENTSTNDVKDQENTSTIENSQEINNKPENIDPENIDVNDFKDEENKWDNTSTIENKPLLKNIQQHSIENKQVSKNIQEHLIENKHVLDNQQDKKDINDFKDEKSTKFENKEEVDDKWENRDVNDFKDMENTSSLEKKQVIENQQDVYKDLKYFKDIENKQVGDIENKQVEVEENDHPLENKLVVKNHPKNTDVKEIQNDFKNEENKSLIENKKVVPKIHREENRDVNSTELNNASGIDNMHVYVKELENTYMDKQEPGNNKDIETQKGNDINGIQNYTKDEKNKIQKENRVENGTQQQERDISFIQVDSEDEETFHLLNNTQEVCTRRHQNNNYIQWLYQAFLGTVFNFICYFVLVIPCFLIYAYKIETSSIYSNDKNNISIFANNMTFVTISLNFVTCYFSNCTTLCHTTDIFNNCDFINQLLM